MTDEFERGRNLGFDEGVSHERSFIDAKREREIDRQIEAAAEQRGEARGRETREAEWQAAINLVGMEYSEEGRWSFALIDRLRDVAGRSLAASPAPPPEPREEIERARTEIHNAIDGTVYAERCGIEHVKAVRLHLESALIHLAGLDAEGGQKG